MTAEQSRKFCIKHIRKKRKSNAIAAVPENWKNWSHRTGYHRHHQRCRICLLRLRWEAAAQTECAALIDILLRAGCSKAQLRASGRQGSRGNQRASRGTWIPIWKGDTTAKIFLFIRPVFFLGRAFFFEIYSASWCILLQKILTFMKIICSILL